MHSSAIFHSRVNPSLLASCKTLHDLYKHDETPRNATPQPLVASPTGRPHILGIDTGEMKANTFVHTLDHSACPACEKARIVIMDRATTLHLLTFSEAFDIWLELHKEEIKPRTYNDYVFYSKRLKKFFGPMQLSQIHIGNILEYRKQRGAGPEIVNHEICTLKQVMEMAGLWDLIEKYYRPLKKPQWTPPKVLASDMEEKFFRVVAAQVNASENNGMDHPWAVAYWATSLSNNTSAIGSELRFLQLQHIFIDHTPPKIHIPDDRVKNEFRARVIPLNPVALKQITRLLERAHKLGSVRPDDYLFPFRIKKGKYDPGRPASPWFIRSAFRSMREALGPEFAWLNPRNFRNQLITKLFESGAPDETIISIAGHQAIRMSRFYSRIRLEAKADALNKISPNHRIAPKSTGNKGKDGENVG